MINLNIDRLCKNVHRIDSCRYSSSFSHPSAMQSWPCIMYIQGGTKVSRLYFQLDLTKRWQTFVLFCYDSRVAALVSFPTLCSHAQIDQRIREILTQSNQTQVCESLWQFNIILWELSEEKSRNYRPALYTKA